MFMLMMMQQAAEEEERRGARPNYAMSDDVSGNPPAGHGGSFRGAPLRELTRTESILSTQSTRRNYAYTMADAPGGSQNRKHLNTFSVCCCVTVPQRSSCGDVHDKNVASACSMAALSSYLVVTARAALAYTDCLSVCESLRVVCRQWMHMRTWWRRTLLDPGAFRIPAKPPLQLLLQVQPAQLLTSYLLFGLRHVEPVSLHVPRSLMEANCCAALCLQQSTYP